MTSMNAMSLHATNMKCVSVVRHGKVGAAAAAAPARSGGRRVNAGGERAEMRCVRRCVVVKAKDGDRVEGVKVSVKKKKKKNVGEDSAERAGDAAKTAKDVARDVGGKAQEAVDAGKSSLEEVRDSAQNAANAANAATDSSTGEGYSVALSLDDVNPVGLGRRSRQLFDNVWRRLTDLGQLTTTRPTDELEYEKVVIGGAMCDFTTPNAELTTVLVAGATGRVGRILVRKLQLRGYKVKALVRNNDQETLEMLPRSVQIVVGDLGDSATLKEAVEGCNKIAFCATARSSIFGDLSRVDHQGVYNLSKAFQDYNHKMAQTRAGRSSKSKLLIAKFSQANSVEGWELREGTYFTDEIAGKYDGGMDAQFEIAEDGNGVFSGYVFTRGGYVELAKRLSLPPGLTLDRYEGLVLSVCGDGKAYTLLLETAPGEDSPVSRQYYTRFSTRLGYSRVRIPFSSFRSNNPEDPPLDPFLVHTLAIRFEPRRMKAPTGRPASNGNGTAAAEGQNNSFKLILDYIKALPGGQETDFILVSCSGAGVSPEAREKVLRAKQAGEAALRNSGVGYTIIRPGPLQEEPGGQRALIFDQGDRITQSISCADVADVCVKALHNPVARNKSFDVCYEYSNEEGLGLYELVAHLPDKSNNYLTPALTVLEKNT